MIYKKCIMTIDKNKATLDEDIYLYRLDKNIELYFTIVNNKYRFNKGDMNNIILITNASFFQVRLYKNAEIKYTFAIQPTDGGQAILTITDDLIDDPIEVGDYDFQISLLDEEKTSMISMPIVSKQLHVCEPLVSDDATMGKAILGLSKLATGEIKNAFDSEGNYIREIHKDGDILSASIINKFEEALDTNTKAIKNGTGTSYDDTAIKTDINTIKTDLGTVELTTADKTVKGAVNEVAAQYKDIASKVENAGQPTQEQINTAIDKAIKDGKVTGTGGINSTAKTLLQTILQNAVYTSNQSNNITALISALGSNESGGGDTPTVKTYTITNNLTHCSNSNTSTSVNENSNYVATITPSDSYTLTNASVNITMGGTDITSTAYNNGTINISSVTGNVVIIISAVEEQIETPTEYHYNIADIASAVHENTIGKEAIYYEAGNGDAGGYGKNEGYYCYVVENLKSGDKLYWKEHSGDTSTSTDLSGFVLYNDGTLGQLGKNPSFTEYHREMQDNYSWYKVNITLSNNYDKLYITFKPTQDNTEVTYNDFIPYLLTTTKR